MTKSLPARHFQALMAGLIAALGLLLSLVAWAAPEAIGTLTEARGRVELNGTPATTGAELRLGMRVVTGTDSQATLKFLDGQTIHLDPESVFWIKNYRYTKDKPKDNRSTTELLKGGMRFISGAMSKESPKAIRVDTPVATIGIRGTEFTVNLDNGLYLHVISGAVTVTAAGQTVTAIAGQVVTVDKAGNPPTLGPAPLPTGSAAPSATATTATTGGTPAATSVTAKAAATTPGISSTAAAATAAAVAGGAAALIHHANQDDPDASP